MMRRLWGIILLISATPGFAQELEPVTLKTITGWGIQRLDDPIRPWGSRADATEDVLADPRTVLDIDISQFGLRGKVLRDSALELGAQAGMSYQLSQLRNQLSQYDALLDRAFNFEPVLLKDGTVQPPVLSTSLDNLAISDDQRILRAAGQSFHIIKQSKFVTVTPSWREYLLNLPIHIVEKPAVMPKTSEEFIAWRSWIVDGWKQGVQQADTATKIRIATLRRDLVGMYLYHILRIRGMVSLPTIKREVVAVSGDSDNLIIDDRTINITALPQMQHDTETWRAIESLPDLFGKGVE